MNVRFFYENCHLKGLAERIIKVRQGLPFQEIDSRWLEIFWAISEKQCRDMHTAIQYSLDNEGALDEHRLVSPENLQRFRRSRIPARKTAVTKGVAVNSPD